MIVWICFLGIGKPSLHCALHLCKLRLTWEHWWRKMNGLPAPDRVVLKIRLIAINLYQRLLLSRCNSSFHSLLVFYFSALPHRSFPKLSYLRLNCTYHRLQWDRLNNWKLPPDWQVLHLKFQQIKANRAPDSWVREIWAPDGGQSGPGAQFPKSPSVRPQKVESWAPGPNLPATVLAGATPKVADTGQEKGGGPVHWQISGHSAGSPLCEQPNTTWKIFTKYFFWSSLLVTALYVPLCQGCLQHLIGCRW